MNNYLSALYNHFGGLFQILQRSSCSRAVPEYLPYLVLLQEDKVLSLK